MTIGSIIDFVLDGFELFFQPRLLFLLALQLQSRFFAELLVLDVHVFLV
jgi:hypothetical protein